MDRIRCLLIVSLASCLACATKAQPVSIRFENQLNAWGAVNVERPMQYQLGARYIPTLVFTDSLPQNRLFDAEVSVHTLGILNAGSSDMGATDENQSSGFIKPYRLWIRYATPRFEVRGGLQKISFGSATIFRPMMWFDRLDFRDPLQLTDGVYALLARYYFRGNANIWLWALYANEGTKGWESLATARGIPEAGGRVQIPLGKGETAMAYHHRSIRFHPQPDSGLASTGITFSENRIGIDGKWDIGPGIWFETTLRHNDYEDLLIKKWETYFNLGTDYTFSVGSGINVTLEYFRLGRSSEFLSHEAKDQFTALAAGYNPGILNTAMLMVYYHFESRQWYRMLSLKRSYDYWSFYLLGFWNPGRLTFYQAMSERNLFSGKGFQFMAVVNF